MNRLVRALLARPDAVEEVAAGDNASFGRLLNELGDELLSEPEWDAIPRARGPGPEALRSAYLPVISAAEWTDALQAAAPDHDENSGWWTVMAPGTSGASGVTVPQDASDEPMVALFSGSPDAPRVVAYSLARRSFLDLPPEVHCTPPTRGRCAAGRCGGCQAIQIMDPEGRDGIACRCDDDG